jgi:GTP-binding protein EngB required for normal cell division
MVFALVDAKVGPTRLDFQMLEWLEAKGLPWRSVATKTDQVKASRAAVRRREVAQALGLRPEDLAWVSAEQGCGVRELRAETVALLGRQD